MPGTHPPDILVGGRQREYPRQYYYVLLDIADQYWLPSVRSASSRFHSAIRRHAPIRFSQAGGQSAHKARPPNLELALTPLDACDGIGGNISSYDLDFLLTDKLADKALTWLSRSITYFLILYELQTDEKLATETNDVHSRCIIKAGAVSSLVLSQQ